MKPCPYCTNGSIAVEPGSSSRYRCPDCKGTGLLDVKDDDPRCDDGDEETADQGDIAYDFS